MRAAGKVQPGDTCQLINVPWVIYELKGSTYIPEGNPHDPLADPGLPPPAQATTNWGEQRDRDAALERAPPARSSETATAMILTRQNAGGWR